MKVGLAGFAGSGKSTVFQWLTGAVPDPSATNRGQIAIAWIPDQRLDWLSQHFKPKKTTYATLEIVDTPGLLATERKDNPRRLAVLREADGLLVVLAAFSGDPVAEFRRFRDELIFADVEVLTNRIEKLEAGGKKPRPLREREADQKEMELLKRIASALEAGNVPGRLRLSPEDEKVVRSFQLFTLKPMMAFLNLGDEQLSQPIPPALAEHLPTLKAAVKLELELAELPEADRQAFMAEMGLAELSRDRLLREIFYGMGRIVFFTVGEDECRAWAIPAGQPAQDAAGVIHTDLAAGFVRAEIVPFEQFKRVGSMKEAKAQGVYRLEGKSYAVQDGDIMHILHS